MLRLNSWTTGHLYNLTLVRPDKLEQVLNFVLGSASPLHGRAQATTPANSRCIVILLLTGTLHLVSSIESSTGCCYHIVDGASRGVSQQGAIVKHLNCVGCLLGLLAEEKCGIIVSVVIYL